MPNSNDKDYFLLFANCIPVKGAKRSIICDLQLNRYRFVPNLLFEIINNNRNKTLEQIKSKYDGDNVEGIDLFFNLLVKENWGFYTDTPNLFPPLDLTWDSPLKVSNCIIDINDKSKFNVLSVIKQLIEINCEALQIRVFNETNIELLKKISDIISESSILCLEIIIRYSKSINPKDLLQLVSFNPRIRQITVFNSPQKKIISNTLLNLGFISYVEDSVSDASHCGVVNNYYFDTNIQLFTESQKHNNCLNKKISIDTNGDIKNCPSMTTSFGNVQNTTLQEALNKKEFYKYWNINKDQIKVCKDCEFRYICTDCRAYTQNPSDIYSKPAKCSYNPYEATWD